MHYFTLSIKDFFGEISYSTKEKIAHYEVSELNKKERDGLLSRYLKFENIELEINDMRLISVCCQDIQSRFFLLYN